MQKTKKENNAEEIIRIITCLDIKFAWQRYKIYWKYFLGEFALAEGKKGGQFYTPRSIVELLVEMLEPYGGRVFDPCCGSGGMFVQKMNLAIRGIDSSQVKWNNEGSFLNDAHKDLKADYIPFFFVLIRQNYYLSLRE